MSRVRTTAAVGVAALLLAGGGDAASPASAARSPRLPAVPAGLPAPVVIATRAPGPCAAARLRPDGRVVPVAAPPTGAVPRSVVFPLNASDLVVARRDDRLVALLLPSRRVLWRSAGRYPSPAVPPPVIGATLGPDRLAFTISPPRIFPPRSRLYVAALDGREHPVPGAGGEVPLGFTATGGLVTREGRGTLRRRAPDGRRPRTLVRGARSVAWDAAGRSALAIDGNALVRLGDARPRRVAGLARLGLAGAPVDVRVIARRRILLIGRGALVILEPSGAVWARDRHGRGADVAGGQGAATSRDGAAVAYTAVRHPVRVVEVRLLRRGDRGARTVGRSAAGKARPYFVTGVAWRGRWLLTWTSVGAVAAIDTRGGRRLLLDRVGRALAARAPARAPGVSAAWVER